MGLVLNTRVEEKVMDMAVLGLVFPLQVLPPQKRAKDRKCAVVWGARV